MDKKEARPKPKKKADHVKIAELTELLQRVQADFENYKKKCAKDYENMKKYSSMDIINKILPILDSFELGLNNKDSDDFVKGMELIYSQLISVLEHEGLAPIKTEGQFDPYRHEVLLQENSEEEEGVILEELQKGYLLNGQVIRHAKVKVAKNAKQTNTTK